MSINSLLTNTPILNALKEIVGGGGGGGSVTGLAPIQVASNVVSLPIGGTWSPSNNIVAGSSATALNWSAGASSGITAVNGSAYIDTANTSGVVDVTLALPSNSTAGRVLASAGTTPDTYSWVSNSTGGGITAVNGSAYIDTTLAGSVADVKLALPTNSVSGKLLASAGTTPDTYSWVSPTTPVLSGLFSVINNYSITERAYGITYNNPSVSQPMLVIIKGYALLQSEYADVYFNFLVGGNVIFELIAPVPNGSDTFTFWNGSFIVPAGSSYQFNINDSNRFNVNGILEQTSV